MSSTPPISCCNILFEHFVSGGQTFLELLGCAEPENPVTEESLKKDFYVVLGAGIICCALLLIGLMGQLGLFPMGNTPASILSCAGGFGMLVTAFAGYRYYKKVQEFGEAEAKRQATAEGSSWGLNFIVKRWDSIAVFLPQWTPVTAKKV